MHRRSTTGNLRHPPRLADARLGRLREMTRRGCLVAIGLFLGLVPAARAGDVTFVSDSSWNVYTPLVTVAPMPGQLGSYDGTAEYVLVNSVYPTTRPPGAIIYDPSLSNPGWTANLSSIPGAYWIWAPGITPKTLGASYAEYQFARTFDLTGTTFSGSISVAVDDFAQVYVNGHLAGSTGSITDESAGLYGPISPGDIRPRSLPGPGPEHDRGTGTEWPEHLRRLPGGLRLRLRGEPRRCRVRRYDRRPVRTGTLLDGPDRSWRLWSLPLSPESFASTGGMNVLRIAGGCRRSRFSRGGGSWKMR